MWYFGSVIVALGLMGYSDCKPQPTIEIDQTGADLSDQEFLSIFDTPNDVTGLSPASTITSDESVTTPHPPHTVDCNPTCQRGTCNGPNQCSCTTSWSRERCNKEFYGAASAGELSFIKGELSTGSSSGLRLNWRNKDDGGWTALHEATYQDKLTVVRALLDAGANTDMKSVGGQTPVYIAAKKGHTAVLRTLLEPKYRADVNLQTNTGQTPVYTAAAYGQTAALELLIAHGGDVNQVTNGGSSPLGIASEKGHVIAVRALLNAGANVGYARPSNGLTALHSAAWKNHADVARLLLQNSAIKNKQDNNGDTPADMSRKYGDGSVARIIDNY